MYGDLSNLRCVEACPRERYAFVNNTFRGCLEWCPERVYSADNVVDMFADNSTWKCVPQCPES
jgi:hypothetical protein